MRGSFSHHIGLAALRLSVGSIFIHHGYAKLLDIAGTAQFFHSVNIPFPALMAWIVALVEFVGGGLIIVGLATEIVALLLAITMVVAIVTTHLGQPFTRAELALAMLGSTVALAALGAGRYSLSTLCYSSRIYKKYMCNDSHGTCCQGEEKVGCACAQEEAVEACTGGCGNCEKKEETETAPQQ